MDSLEIIFFHLNPGEEEQNMLRFFKHHMLRAE
jgi:hypothetical protein